MKKLIAAALAALTVALFTACANDGQLAYIGDEAARAYVRGHVHRRGLARAHGRRARGRILRCGRC